MLTTRKWRRVASPTVLAQEPVVRIRNEAMLVRVPEHIHRLLLCVVISTGVANCNGDQVDLWCIVEDLASQRRHTARIRGCDAVCSQVGQKQRG